MGKGCHDLQIAVVRHDDRAYTTEVGPVELMIGRLILWRRQEQRVGITGSSQHPVDSGIHQMMCIKRAEIGSLRNEVVGIQKFPDVRVRRISGRSHSALLDRGTRHEPYREDNREQSTNGKTEKEAAASRSHALIVSLRA